MDELLSVLAARTSRAASSDMPAVITSLSPLEVDLGGQIVPARNGMPNWPHSVDDIVRVTRYGLSLVITSTTMVLPTAAVVTVATGGSSTVTVQDAAGLTYDVQIVGTAPTVGTDVVLYWTADGGYCLGQRGVAASPPPPPKPPPPPARSLGTDTPPSQPPSSIVKGTATLWAQQTGTARSGDWRRDGEAKVWLYQGHYSGGASANNTGYWFYGSQVDKVRGAALTVTRAQIWLKRASGIGASGNHNVHLVRHDARRKTSNPQPTHASYTTIELRIGESGWFDIPTSWGQAIADGGPDDDGIGVAYSGTSDYMALVGIDGKSRDARSGALKIDFKRS